MLRETEGRCPDCGSYCPQNLLTGRFFCVKDGWFDKHEAEHTVGEMA